MTRLQKIGMACVILALVFALLGYFVWWGFTVPACVLFLFGFLCSIA
jgi:hypothetical protein